MAANASIDWSAARLLLMAAVAVAPLVPRPVTAQEGRAQVRYKGVWEPVNYPADLMLTDVHFATADVGWVTGGIRTGGGGVILHTRDGGESWAVQLGDPESTEATYQDLRFVDRATGFAVQRTGSGDHRLLRTTDGESWEISGTVPQHRGDYAFVSPTLGFTAYRSDILRTDDAGRNWRKVGECGASVEIDGLMRNAACNVANFHFPSASVGYAIGSSNEARGLFVARTTDGGQSWSVHHTLPDESGHDGHVFFTSEQNGVACLIGGKFFRTSDGGQTWQQTPGPSCEGKPWVKFADAEVGWTLAYRTWTYTVNGGRRWTSREIAFPAMVEAFSLPRRDRGYVIGDHGMIYRYRVVPDTATVAPRAITAPAMPRPAAAASGGARD